MNEKRFRRRDFLAGSGLLLAGVILGWVAMPVFLITLFLQALLFQFGGITTLGINTVTMGIPAVVCFYLYGSRFRSSDAQKHAFVWGMAAGSTALALSFVLWAFALLLCGRQLGVIVALSVGPHSAIIIVEIMNADPRYGFMPLTNMWWPQTMNPRPAMAEIE